MKREQKLSTNSETGEEEWLNPLQEASPHKGGGNNNINPPSLLPPTLGPEPVFNLFLSLGRRRASAQRDSSLSLGRRRASAQRGFSSFLREAEGLCAERYLASLVGTLVGTPWYMPPCIPWLYASLPCLVGVPASLCVYPAPRCVHLPG